MYSVMQATNVDQNITVLYLLIGYGYSLWSIDYGI